VSESASTNPASSKRLTAPQAVLEYVREMERQDGTLRLLHLAKHVCDEAAERLKRDQSRSDLFRQKSFTAYVVSLDLRRSTDMMLLAKDADHFAAFMRRVFDELGHIVRKNLGVIEKFTGDGLLAYFPVGFSGPHAGYRAVKASDEALKFFTSHYARRRSHFNCVLEDFGLSAGIDFGEVQLREITQTPSLLGRPVVFACRLSSGPRGAILVNQSAYDHLQESCTGGVCFENASLEIKHLGTLACYRVKKQDIALPLKNPDWYAGTPMAND
jgi:adenylate cyclase